MSFSPSELHPITSLLQGPSSATIDLRLACTPAVMAQATGAVRVLRHPSYCLPPPQPQHTYSNLPPLPTRTHTQEHTLSLLLSEAPGLTLICLWRKQSENFLTILWELKTQTETIHRSGNLRKMEWMLNQSQDWCVYDLFHRMHEKESA